MKLQLYILGQIQSQYFRDTFKGKKEDKEYFYPKERKRFSLINSLT
jgi:hypothetical protein